MMWIRWCELLGAVLRNRVCGTVNLPFCSIQYGTSAIHASDLCRYRGQSAVMVRAPFRCNMSEHTFRWLTELDILFCMEAMMINAIYCLLSEIS